VKSGPVDVGKSKAWVGGLTRLSRNTGEVLKGPGTVCGLKKGNRALKRETRKGGGDKNKFTAGKEPVDSVQGSEFAGLQIPL